jgi:hypothetical protein
VLRAAGERVGGSQGVALFELAGRPRISGVASTCERHGRGGLCFRMIAHTAVGQRLCAQAVNIHYETMGCALFVRCPFLVLFLLLCPSVVSLLHLLRHRRVRAGR